jgi:hypothetical protein
MAFIRLTSGDDVFLRGGQWKEEGDQAAVLHLSNNKGPVSQRRVIHPQIRNGGGLR